MSIGIGVVGAGIMGADHARIVSTQLSGAHLAAVADADSARAEAFANGGKVFTDAYALISDPSVEAVIVASPDATHQGLVLAAIGAGKPVLCEKPLATSTAECLQIVEAEARAGRPMVQTGFMRRFDPTYREMKATLASGELGPLRMLHCQHRNVSAPDWFNSNMAITNSFVHEIDVCRWLLDTEFTAGTVIPYAGKDREGASADPLLIVLETPSGVVISTEVFINADYGYHVDAEAVCAKGTIRMGQPALTVTKVGGAERSAYPPNWIPRFADAYRIQNQAWVDAIKRGQIAEGASSAWDGTVATSVAEQVVEALRSRQRKEIRLPDRPV